jgi:hypothetical protein
LDETKVKPAGSSVLAGFYFTVPGMGNGQVVTFHDEIGMKAKTEPEKIIKEP